MAEITINGLQVTARDGVTILTAAREAGFTIPTLCFLEGTIPQGACRACVVEVEGSAALAAACSTPIHYGMVIHTNTKRVREARRTVVELLLSEHAGECQTCMRSTDCELLTLAQHLGIRHISFDGEPIQKWIDASTPALSRDPGKCIKCRRCVNICHEVQQVGALAAQYRGFDTLIGPAFSQPLSSAACVQCGQCAAVCPTGAIIEVSHIEQVWAAIDDPKKHVVVQTAPAIRAALGECFGCEPGTLVTGKMVTALRELGFDAVFDTNFTADLTIIEEGSELLKRLEDTLVHNKLAPLPQYTSCSPGWIQYAEYFHPEILPNISTCKSPQQMFGALAKTYYAQKIGVDPADMTVVSIMPCTAKKFEAKRPEMNSSGYQDVDYVLTTRELGDMIKMAGIEFMELPDQSMDAPFGISTGAADIFANTGGVMEAALRTVYALVTGRILPADGLHIAPLAGLDGIKTAEVTMTDTVERWRFLEGVTVRVAVAHGLGNASALIDRIQNSGETYHFVEVMTCPGGCIGGGGQPRFTTDAVRKARISAIYREDEGRAMRQSHDNPYITQLYDEFLKSPLGEISHHLLHTHYHERRV